MALCSRCEAHPTDTNAGATDVGERWPAEATCARCGAVLAPGDVVDAMLVKLAQLSRFGLGADDRPLLAHTDTDDP